MFDSAGRPAYGDESGEVVWARRAAALAADAQRPTWDGVSFGEDGRPLGWEQFSVSERDRVAEVLTDRARQAAAVVSAAEAALVDAVRALQPVMGVVQATPRAWVAWQCGLTPAEAARVVTLAQRLEELPGVRARFEAGELSADTAYSIVKVTTPEIEDKVLAVAEVTTGAQLQRLLRDFRALQRPQEEPTTEASTVDTWWTRKGRLKGRLDLGAVDGALFEAALDAQRAEDPKAAHAAVASGELRPEEIAPLTKADALGLLCERALAATANAEGLVPETNTVIARLNDDGTATIDGAGAVPASEVGYLGCQALWYAVAFAGYKPVTQTSKQRFFTGTMRRTLLARDRSCQFPGCGRHRHLHAHHNDEFTDEESKLDEGALLCPQHHRLVHRLGYRIRRDPDGTITLTRRDGTTLVSRPPPHPPPDTLPTPTGQRTVVQYDPLTLYARDVIIHDWCEPPPDTTPPPDAEPAEPDDEPDNADDGDRRA